MDETGNRDQTPSTANESNNGSSRRTFLKAAVIGSASAAAAVGAAGVAASALGNRAPSNVTKLLGLANASVSGGSGACASSNRWNNGQGSINGNSTFFVYAWFTTAAAGNYYTDINFPTLATGSFNTSGGNEYAYDGDNTIGCPSPNAHPKPQQELAVANGTEIDFTTPKDNDTVLVEYQLNADNIPSGTTVSLSVTIGGPGGYSQSASVDVTFA